MPRLDCDALRVDSFSNTVEGDPSQWAQLAPPDTYPTTDARYETALCMGLAAAPEPGVSCCPKHCTW